LEGAEITRGVEKHTVPNLNKNDFKNNISAIYGKNLLHCTLFLIPTVHTQVNSTFRKLHVSAENDNGF
jgi:hypothetical protein